MTMTQPLHAPIVSSLFALLAPPSYSSAYISTHTPVSKTAKKPSNRHYHLFRMSFKLFCVVV